MEGITKIRWHSRAGQGAITASNALAQAIGKEKNKFTQSFSEFGAEKRGAPIKAFTRIANEAIDYFHQIQNPDYLVLFDTTLLNKGELSWNDVLSGLNKNGKLLVNTGKKESSANFKGEIWHLNATKIALEEIGKNIPNVPFVGGLLKISNLYPLDKFETHLKKVLST